jgi:hypothetical protein
MTGRRWCARWAWGLFLIVGACQPPPIDAAQATPILAIVHYAAHVDTFKITAPAQIELWPTHDSTAAHILCGLVWRYPPQTTSMTYSFAIRWAGDTIRTVVDTWRPFCEAR